MCKFESIYSATLVVATITVIVLVKIGESNTILESPRITNWGDWGIMEKCPTGEFVTGMRLKTERITYKITGDNTGLNGIQFFCAKPGGKIDGRKFITSSYANWGTWGSTFQCPGRNRMMTGFQLRSDKSRGILLGLVQADDTAANNLRMFCNQSKLPVEGDGTYWGLWTEPMHCFEHQAVCGLKTQVEWSQGLRDDTALNNIEIECCDFDKASPPHEEIAA